MTTETTPTGRLSSLLSGAGALIAALLAAQAIYVAYFGT